MKVVFFKRQIHSIFARIVCSGTGYLVDHLPGQYPRQRSKLRCYYVRIEKWIPSDTFSDSAWKACRSAKVKSIRNLLRKRCSMKTWILAAAWQNQRNDCAPSEDRPAWASAQSDQSLHCPHEEVLVLSYLLSAQRRLIRLGGCPGWSESSLGAQAMLLVLSCCGSYRLDLHPQVFTPYVNGWIVPCVNPFMLGKQFRPERGV